MNLQELWNEEVFSAKDSVFRHGQAENGIVAKNFLLLVLLRCNSRGQHNDLVILFL